MSEHGDRVLKQMRENPLFPFIGDMEVKALGEPMAAELDRDGENGKPCHACGDQSRVIWRNDRWQISTIKPTANPVGLFLETIEHLDLEHFDERMASEYGVLTVHIEAAIRSLDSVGRVHIHRWGDGSEHFHVWFQGRPARQLELYGWGNVLWSQLLDPLPSDLVAANHAAVVERLLDTAGGTAVGDST